MINIININAIERPKQKITIKLDETLLDKPIELPELEQELTGFEKLKALQQNFNTLHVFQRNDIKKMIMYTIQGLLICANNHNDDPLYYQSQFYSPDIIKIVAQDIIDININGINTTILLNNTSAEVLINPEDFIKYRPDEQNMISCNIIKIISYLKHLKLNKYDNNLVVFFLTLKEDYKFDFHLHKNNISSIKKDIKITNISTNNLLYVITNYLQPLYENSNNLDINITNFDNKFTINFDNHFNNFANNDSMNYIDLTLHRMNNPQFLKTDGYYYDITFKDYYTYDKENLYDRYMKCELIRIQYPTMDSKIICHEYEYNNYNNLCKLLLSQDNKLQ